MENHFHVVLELKPSEAYGWSDREVAERWVSLSPDSVASRLAQQRAQALLSDKHQLARIRQRLGCLSWFMRYLKEPIARRANREDECTGRFWEGRFRCQALLDDTALLACMAYVDLNPVRAGLCNSPRMCTHTSFSTRLRRDQAHQAMIPVAGSVSAMLIETDVSQYTNLLESLSHARSDRKGPKSLATDPTRSYTENPCLSAMFKGIEIRFGNAVGGFESLRHWASSRGLQWAAGQAFMRRTEANRRTLTEIPLPTG
jgi:hypothetical protein